MSNVIDQKVVEMRFDNKQFENNVQTSLSTLDRLKKSLNMEGATKGLENVDAASKKLNFSGLSSAVETVQAKFSAFEVMAVTALANITNSAINAGKQMLRSLTIEPVSQGFNEYELKMGSIQTIMASTGASLKEVNGYLNELNTYADKTIYSFSDMTNNIGKFTNAGVKLEDAVLAIKGVSNEAAVSGANANEASRAMYNFAQALSAGYVKLIDWKSIENANMATVEFKNELLKAAEAAGTVKKQADGMYRVLTKNNQGSTMDLAIDATKNFNDSLNYQWMTTEVLVNTLKDYADETTEIGKKAFSAAQDVKTFSQLMDTLKEAVGSGWAMTFELIFGDFEEAKELWTGVSQVVGGFIDQQSQARNDLLAAWNRSGGRTALIDSFKNSFDGLKYMVMGIRSQAGLPIVAFGEIITDVLSSIIVRNTEFYDAARDMVAGFANGISANTFLAEAKAAEMAAAAARAARRELDEHSPSKVGYEIGDFFGVAFVGAIGDYADKSYRAGAEMGSKARIGLTEAVSKISDYINSDIDAQPTIRPVLDLSNVQSGTRQINAMFSRTQAMSINANMSRAHTSGNQNGGFQDGFAATYNYFTQNNYSPKALSRVEIYRQTKNQFSAMKGTVSKR